MEVQVRESKQDIGLNTCILPVDIFKAFNLSPDVMYNIHFGRVSQYSYILPGDQEKSGMFFSKLIFSQLALFEDITLNIKNVGKDIYLGPVVGIFVTPEYFKKMLDANRNFHTEQHLRGGFSQGCFVYYFTLENINWTEKKVYGYTLFPSTKKGGMYWMPMPDIMYDRAVNHSLMYKFNAEQVRRQFQNGLNIRCINSRISFGKWEIYKGLSKHRQIKKYLPETKPYKRGKDFIHMLDKYGFLFLKSFYGSSGKEVLSIEKEDKKFKLNFYDKGLRNMSFDDISQVEGFIKSFMKEKSFIVQQGIRLLEFKGRKFDVRMVLQKDENGLWKSNLNVCRLAKDKLTITNVDTGGEITTYEEIYPDLFIQGGKVPDRGELEEAAASLASYIEEEFGPHGEIGMDMAIDIHGGIWFIEANARPGKFISPKMVDVFGKPWMKSLNSRNKGDESILPMAASVFKYARFLFEKGTS